MAESNMKTYIYVLKNPINLEIRYVGKTTCLKRRFRSHICAKAKKNSYLSSWIGALRIKGLLPLMEVIDTVYGNDWKQKESDYIALHRNQGCKLVNLTDGGEGCDGYKHSDETKIKMSLIKKQIIPKFIPTMAGRKHTADSKKKISIKHLGEKNHNYGKIVPIGVRKKISETLGKKVTINNIVYPSMRSAAKDLNMAWGTFKYRYKNDSWVNLI